MNTWHHDSCVGIIPTSSSDLEEALEMGIDWSLREGYAWPEDKEVCLLSLFVSLHLFMSLYVSLCLFMSLYVSLKRRQKWVMIGVFAKATHDPRIKRCASCLFLSFYVSLCLSMSLYVSLCLFMSLYVSLCLFMSLSVSVCLSMSLSVSFCLFLSLSVSFCLFLVSLCLFMSL